MCWNSHRRKTKQPLSQPPLLLKNGRWVLFETAHDTVRQLHLPCGLRVRSLPKEPLWRSITEPTPGGSAVWQGGTTRVSRSFQRLQLTTTGKQPSPTQTLRCELTVAKLILKRLRLTRLQASSGQKGVVVVCTGIHQIFPPELGAILCNVLIWIWLRITSVQSLNWKASLTPTHEIQLSSNFFNGYFPFHQRMCFKREQVDISISLENSFRQRCSISIEGSTEEDKLLNK